MQSLFHIPSCNSFTPSPGVAVWVTVFVAVAVEVSGSLVVLVVSAKVAL